MIQYFLTDDKRAQIVASIIIDDVAFLEIVKQRNNTSLTNYKAVMEEFVGAMCYCMEQGFL